MTNGLDGRGRGAYLLGMRLWDAHSAAQLKGLAIAALMLLIVVAVAATGR